MASTETRVTEQKNCDLRHLEARIDDLVGFKGRDEYVKDPEEDKNSRSDGLDGFGSTQLATNGGVTTQHQDDNG